MVTLMILYILEQTDQFVGRGGAANQYIEAYTPFVYNRHVEILGLFRDATRLLAKEEDQKALLGLFYMLHEQHGWDKDLYNLENIKPANVIEAFGRNSRIKKGNIKHAFATDVKSKIDPNITSPIDGHLLAGPERIKDSIGREMKVSLEKIIVTQNRVATHIESLDRQGKASKTSTPTTSYLYTNMQEQISFLNAQGGYTIAPLDELPVNHGLARIAVLKKLDEVRRTVNDAIDYAVGAVRRLIKAGQVGVGFEWNAQEALLRKAEMEQKLLA